jgi:RNA polymerase sigma factor (sigma-70 family)
MRILQLGRRPQPQDREAEEQQQFQDWIQPHWSPMRRLAERLVGQNLRDDVLQEALFSAWRSRTSYDETLGTPRTWLLSITANHARKALRSRKGTEPLSDVPTEAPMGTRIDVERAIHTLAPRQRLAIELYYFVGLSIAETASVMGSADGTAKATLASGRARLREILGEDYR